MKSKCAISGCERDVQLIKHQLCRAHYIRYIRKGEVSNEPIRKRVEVKPYSKTLDGSKLFNQDNAV